MLRSVVHAIPLLKISKGQLFFLDKALEAAGLCASYQYYHHYYSGNGKDRAEQSNDKRIVMRTRGGTSRRGVWRLLRAAYQHFAILFSRRSERR